MPPFMGKMPEFIIVGIKNTDRAKDIFPEEVTYGDGSKGGGRADRYLDFIRDELMPYIDETYRTGNFRVLYGTSNTGFTTVYALFRSPDMAQAYIAASATLSIPSFRAKRDEWIRDFKGGKRRLVAVMGENDLPTVLSQNGALKEALDTLAPPDLTGQFRVIGNGGHVPAESLQEGMSALFEGWQISLPLKESTFRRDSDAGGPAPGKIRRSGQAPRRQPERIGRSAPRRKKDRHGPRSSAIPGGSLSPLGRRPGQPRRRVSPGRSNRQSPGLLRSGARPESRPRGGEIEAGGIG